MTVGGPLQASHADVEIDLRESTWGSLGRVLDRCGEMGHRIRETDWGSTPLGTPDIWTTSLRTALALVLASRFPMRLCWGQDLVMLYNDAYISIPGDKHPVCLGRPAAEIWPEVWDDIGPMMRSILDGGPATWSQDRLLVLHRHGYAEECFFTFSYSPVVDDDESVGGVIAVVNETTGRVLSERRLSTLRLLAERVAASRTREDVCQRVVETVAVDDADVPFAAMYLAGDDRGSLVLAASRGTPVHDWPPVVPPASRDAARQRSTGCSERDLGLALRTVLEQGSMLVEQMDVEAGNGWRSLLLVPVVTTGRTAPRGVLALCVHPRRRLDSDLRDFVDLVAGHVATALGAQEYAARRQSLADAALALSGPQTLGGVLDVVAQQARALVSARHAMVLLTSGDGDTSSDSDDAGAEDPLERGAARLTIPLRGSDGAQTGLLRLEHRAGGEFTHDDQALLAQLAQVAAVRIENTRLHEQERHVAVALQRSLLPQATPAAPGLVVASRYLPGANGTEVGGDWYDVIELPGRRTGLVIGDVLGRGVRAAAVMGQLRAVLRAYALEGLAPAALLQRLDVVVRSFDATQLTTCTYAVFDPADLTLTMATAGHLPPLLLTRDGEATLLTLDPGLPLGVGGHGVDPDYRETVVLLAPGASMLLFTDGLVEEHRLPVGEGLELLREAMQGADATPEELCDRALRTMGRDLTHGDDTAVLAVRSLPEGGPGGHQTFEIELGASVGSARRARRFVRDGLTSGGVGTGLVQSAELLVSELVTNVVVHAGNAMNLAVSLTDHAVTVTVSDADATMPRWGSQADDLAEGGRGMVLVEEIASRWGADLHPQGKRVWFQLDRPRRAPPPSPRAAGDG